MFMDIICLNIVYLLMYVAKYNNIVQHNVFVARKVWEINFHMKHLLLLNLYKSFLVFPVKYSIKHKYIYVHISSDEANK